MPTGRGVILTYNSHDYALAAAAQQMIAQREDLEACYPIQLPTKTLRSIERLFDYYGTRPITLESRFPASDPVGRSEIMQQELYTDKRATKVNVNAAPAVMGSAVMSCIAEQRALVFTGDEEVDPASASVYQTRGRPEHLLFVSRHSSHFVAAAVYATATNKRLKIVDSIEDVFAYANVQNAASCLVVDEFHSFTKRTIERLVAWRSSGSSSLPPAIMTAYSPAAFTGLIWRTLEHRDFRKSGGRSTLIKPFELVDLKHSSPIEYSVWSEHGNESHMHYGGEVLCGAISSEFRGDKKRSFNCEWGCPHEGRISASDIPVHHLAILSCSTFTLGDGVVTPDFSLLLNFVNGWPISIIAPFRHAMATPNLAVLTDALISSGMSLAEVTEHLNSVIMIGSQRDPAYVLLGDPETVVSDRPYQLPKTSLEFTDRSATIEISDTRDRFVECQLPGTLIRDLLSRGERPSVRAGSGVNDARGIYFGFSKRDDFRAPNLFLFSEHELPTGKWSVHLGAADPISNQQRESALQAVNRIRAHRSFGVEPALIAKLEDSIVGLLRSKGKSSGYLEPLCPSGIATWESALSTRLTKVRHALLGDLLRRSKDRVWLNHHYSEHYASSVHLPPVEASSSCPFCDNQIESWRYQDNCTGLDSRDVIMCSRCGIIADHPTAQDIEIVLEPVSGIEGQQHRQKIKIANRRKDPINVSFFVQFHSWKALGIEGEPTIYDGRIEANSSVEKEIAFSFARPLPDYIHDIMAYVLTEELNLYCVGQRVATRQKGFFPMPKQPHHDPTEFHHHAHPTNGSVHTQPRHEPHGPGAAPRKSESKPAVVIVEPHAALLRYVAVAHRRFKTVVVTHRPDRCLGRERYYNRSMGQPNGTHIDRIIQVDTSDAEAMYQSLRTLPHTIAGVVAGDDVFVPVTAELGRKLGFDYAAPKDAQSQHLKTEMKLRFEEKGVPTPRFFICRTFEEAKTAWEKLGRDCMAKMVDFEASINIFRVRSLPELEAAWDTIVNKGNDLKVPFRLAQEVILEEFVSGRELTVEGYTQDSRVVCLNFCEKVTDNFIVVGHYLPALVSSEESEILQRVAEQCVRAVGMRNTVFHVELHLQGNVPYVIECASRPPGANMVELMHGSYGFDLMEISLSLAVGETVQELPRPARKHYAMFALYSHQGGILERIEGLDELQRRGGVGHLHLDVKPGDMVEPLSGSHQRDGFIMLEDSTAEGVREKVRWMQEHVRFALTGNLKEAVAIAS